MTTFPVAITRDLPAQRVMRAKVGDSDLAVWRGASGQVQATNKARMRLRAPFSLGEVYDGSDARQVVPVFTPHR